MGFTYPGRLATPIEYNEAETGSLALRLALSPHEASPDRVTPPHARSATCQTDNLQGELLSVHKIDQALPGAPGLTGLTGFLCRFPDETGKTQSPSAKAFTMHRMKLLALSELGLGACSIPLRNADAVFASASGRGK